LGGASLCAIICTLETEHLLPTRMNLFSDWSANRGNLKGRLVLVCFRLAVACRRLPSPLWWLTVPYLIWYELTIIWGLGIELRYKAKVGPGLKLYHGHALVVNDGVVIGARCALRHCTTIGSKQLPDGSESACPVLGDDVNVGANAVILGPIKIGDRAVIGAGAVVVKDVPAGAVVGGNPARVIRQADAA
jgi:putative colanic acid biosynthesis acetyltransferase WcaB